MKDDGRGEKVMEGRKRREWEEWRKEGQQEKVGKGEKRGSRGKGRTIAIVYNHFLYTCSSAII